MGIYAISDLHLSFGTDKPMDIFGGKWQEYDKKLVKGWQENVSPEDTVIMPGDISWATYLEGAIADFSFIEALPGRKVILKGNHDYWWTTANKLENFCRQNNFKSITFLQNKCYLVSCSDVAICGSRGWKCPGEDDFDAEDRKLYEREIYRLKLSLDCAKRAACSKIITALHFPPFNYKIQESGFVSLMMEYDVDICIYGHLHGEGLKNAFAGIMDGIGIEFRPVSADHIDFTPVRIM